MHTSRCSAHFWIATQAALLQQCRASSALPNLTCCCGTTFTKLFKPFVSWLDFSLSFLNYLFFCYYIETILASQSLDTDVCLPRAAWSSSSRWRWSPWRGRMGRQHVLQLGGRHGGRVWRGLGSSSLFYALGSRNFFSQQEPLLLLSMARILSNLSLPKGSFKDLRYWHRHSGTFQLIIWMKP